MSLNPEESKRRLQRRQEDKKRRQKLLRTLTVAGAALLIILLLILAVSDGKEQKPASSGKPVETTGQTQPAPETKKVIHLIAGGDLEITETVTDSGGLAYDYTDAFIDVAPVLAGGDITLLNFEGNLYGAPYGVDRSAPQSLVTGLANAGVDMLQLANTYSVYKGMDGLAETIAGIRGAGMEPLGTYPSSKAAKEAKGYTIRMVNGIKIAFVAFTKGMDGMILLPGNEGCVNLLFTDYYTDYQKIDKKGITKILDAVAREKPDLTVALVHWGSKRNDDISDTQKEITRLMQENNVDAIIGTHPNFLQKMEYDPATGQFVAYALGTFFGDAKESGTEYSVLLDLEITKDLKTKKTKITNYSYTPVFTVVEEGKPARVVRIAQTMAAYEGGYIDKISQKTYSDMGYALQRIEARVKGK